jgi:ketosteroid isomerase-like protein
MSEENVETVLKAVDAANRADAEAFEECLHPEVEWEESGDPLPGLRGVYHGPSAVRGWFEEAFLEVWESLHLKVDAITTAGDRVLLGFTGTARGRESGARPSYVAGMSSGSRAGGS